MSVVIKHCVCVCIISCVIHQFVCILHFGGGYATNTNTYLNHANSVEPIKMKLVKEIAMTWIDAQATLYLPYQLPMGVTVVVSGTRSVLSLRDREFINQNESKKVAKMYNPVFPT